MDFQPIFDYIDQNSIKLKEDIMTEVREEIRPIKTTLANVMAEMEGIRTDNAIANHRIKRLETWAEPVGNKVGIPIKL